MPNWCMNTVVLENESKKEIDKLVEFLETKATDSNGFFSYLCPRPESEEDDWYNWNVNNWGTKWEVIPEKDCTTRLTDTSLQLSFDTAWAPPIAFFEYLDNNTEWKVAEANYHEPGMSFVGRYADGIDDSYEYTDAYDDIDELDNIPEDILEYWCIRDDVMDHIQENQEDEEDIELDEESEEELEDLAKLAELQEEYKDVDLEKAIKELNEELDKLKKENDEK